MNNATATSMLLRFCALALAEPTEESLSVLREQPCQRPWLGAAIEEIQGLPLDLWQGEHTRLFTFPALCPPFASAYLEGGMAGNRMDTLADLYAEYGLEATGLPDDYLGTICEFGAFLHEEGDRDGLTRLWEEGLKDWLSRFATHLCHRSELRFYRGLGEDFLQLAEAGPWNGTGH